LTAVALAIAVVAGVASYAVRTSRVLASLPVAPADEFESLGRLSELALAVFDEVADVTLDESGPALRVTFVNSAFHLLSEREQAAKARQIARVLIRNYEGRHRIRIVVVEFAAGSVVALESKAYSFFRPSLR
jgi:hypothetical protein